MKRTVIAVAVVISLACAGVGPARRAERPLESAAEAGWRALVEGDLAQADAGFAAGSGDFARRFGRIALASARGDDGVAFDASLDLLLHYHTEAQVGRVDARAALLADATAAGLSALLESVIDPRLFEDRLLALPLNELPWRARLAIESAVDAVARRRGDITVLEARAGYAGCLTDVREVGRVGRLPRLDLARQWSADVDARPPVRSSGCRLWLPPGAGWPGVRILRAHLPPARETRTLIFDHLGPALIKLSPRLAAGVPAKVEIAQIEPAAHWHDSGAIHEARARAITVPPSITGVTVEIRLGDFGGATELRLFAFPATPGDNHPTTAVDAGAGEAGLMELARLLAAEIIDDTDVALAEAGKLANRKRFAVGLIAAARVLAADPSRPAALSRAEADGLLRRALKAAPGLPRAALDLARAEQIAGRTLDAAGLAETALTGNPRFWPAALVLSEAQRARGLERQADTTLQKALDALGERSGACPLLQLALDRAHAQHQVEREATLMKRLTACDAQASRAYEWHTDHGDLDQARRALALRARTAVDPAAFALDLATLDIGSGDPAAAVRRLRALVTDRPRDAGLRIRVADALLAAGQRGPADRILADTVRWFPTDPNVPKLARLRGLDQPLQAFHVDGRAVIAEYRAAKRDYAAPAVLVLDRTVMRVLEDGTQLVLTHNIVNVKGKDGITRWGEVAVPPNAEILTLRTIKSDGSTREPEEISGKETISAPDLAPGDFVEWETIEYRPPVDNLAPGFLTDRFYFQSVELPLHLSELVLVVPRDHPVDLDARAGAPKAVESAGPEGTRMLTFTARHMAQLFAERAAVRAEDWIPSVRASAHLNQGAYLRSLRDGLFGVARSTPVLRAEAARIAATAGAKADDFLLAATLVRWVLAEVEAESSLFDPATASLARRRGNRAGLIVAFARALGLDAEIALARSLDLAPADAPVVAQELDDFGTPLVRLQDRAGHVAYVDPRHEHAGFGYLPPHLDGARVLRVETGTTELARGRGDDLRHVAVKLKVDAAGVASGEVIETLRGWPAIEWAAFAKATADDPRKRRQEFEQRWLGQQFPGARLGGVAIDLDPAKPGQARLRYSFVGLELGAAADGAYTAPAFFRIGAARRYATASTRRTSLLLGPEIPLELDAEIAFPPGSRVLDLGRGGEVKLSGTGVSLAERRQIIAPSALASGPVVKLQRSARVPLVRVSATSYEETAATLRRMDALERDDVRVALPTSPASPQTGAP
ncbi:MAG TPA: tetratricopeptide repeat protein [Polyangia bacterium]